MPPKYEPCTAIEWRTITGPTPGARAFLAEVLAHYGAGPTNQSGVGSDGIYNHRMVRGSRTAHSNHASGRAIDVHVSDNGPGRLVGYDLFQRITRDPAATAVGVCEAIYYRQRWDGTSNLVKPYLGHPDDHKTHVHVTMTADVAHHPCDPTNPADPLRVWFRHFLFEV